MNSSLSRTLSTLIFLLLIYSPFGYCAGIDEALSAEHRSALNKARDSFRHPKETLEFFGLKPDMTVVEILPGGGWYTEILAPLLWEKGTLYAAQYSPNSSISYQPRILQGFETATSAKPEVYGKVITRHLYPPNETVIAPPASADMILTFRNVHNWIMVDQENEHFAAFYAALKPGGVLGVVEHRAAPGSGMEIMKTTGYVTEAYTIELAEKAGFILEAKSDINANPKDLKNYDNGVWTLPPTYALGEKDKARYQAIGESDRMTLRFRKPK
ncbi:class I SAM-dependent methyltransferase [Aurantivibrio infirmus]